MPPLPAPLLTAPWGAGHTGGGGGGGGGGGREGAGGGGGGWACRHTVAAFCLATRLGCVADANPGCWQQEKLHFIPDDGITCG